MNRKKIWEDKEQIEKEIKQFLEKKQIKKIEENEELTIAHLRKAKHNLSFYNLNKNHNTYKDWLIVILYYTLYHCALALITKKNYHSKNHYATLLILVKEYHISTEEAELIHRLSLSKEDAELYTELKEERHKASYVAHSEQELADAENYEEKILAFIQKTEDLIRK